jgi:pimeloyl-ACP methyl ester carboxylesterase
VGLALRLPVYRTHPILTGDSTVVRAVVVVHGADRNPGPYFDRMVKAVALAGLIDSTLVISPHFQTESDGPGQSQPAWTSGGWKRGHKSVAYPGVNERISSYEAVDDVLAYVADQSLFPRLRSIVVTGHSAGGQYAHRFAATSPAENRHPHLDFRYVVVNPSTYLYLGPERATPGGGFEVPDREACPNYNRWHYGLEDRNSYASALTEEELRARLVERDVVYMVGSADTG